ncbi:MAG: hypothetical protein QXT67_08890 [Candidatus Bathyarchaeia archaeon]
MKIVIYYTGVASDIVKDMFTAWLDGWQVPWEKLTTEDKYYLEELGFIEHDENLNVGEGEKFRSGVYNIKGKSKDIIVLFGDEADIVCGIKITTTHPGKRDSAEFIIEKFREIEQVL